MPLYSIQGPDGRTYEIEGPAGATREQVIAAIQAQLRQNRRSSPSIEELVDAEVAAAMAVGQGSPEDAGCFEYIISGFGSGLVGTGEMASLGAASLLEEESELAAREKIKSVADSLRPEGGDPDDISYLVSSGLGSIVGALAPAVAAAFLPVSAPVAGGIGLLGAGAINIGSGAGEASERARAADATEEERNLATLRGAGIGVLGIVPLGRILRIPGASKLAEKIGGKAVEEGGTRIRSALTTGGLEAATEAAEGFLQNLNERGYNPERELLDAGIIDDAIAGGGAGAIVQAVTDFFIRGKSKGRAATELDEEGRAATELAESPPDLTDTELLQAIDEEGLSATGIPPTPPEPTKPLTDAETLQAINEEGLLEYGDSRSRGQVQEDLLSILDTEAVEPSSRLVDTETTDTLADFSQDDIRGAVDTLMARGVEPSAVTEDAVRAELVETKAREAEALEGVDFADPVAFDQPDIFTSELREARAADPAEALRQDLSRRGELVPQRESITPDPIEPIAPVQEDLIGDLDEIELGDVEAAAVERTFEDLKRAKRDQKALQQASDLESIDARREGDRQRATEDKRYGILQEVIETNPTRNYNTLRTAFERALADDGITNAKASDRERETIRRAVNMQMAERASLRAPLSQDPAQESFPGLGKRSARQAAANRPVVEEAPPTPAPQPVDAEFLDRLGIPSKARIRKRVEGKDLNDPDVRAAFSSFLGDRRAGRQTKLNVQRMLEGVPDEQLQLPGLFDSRRGSKDARTSGQSEPGTGGTSVQSDSQTVEQGGVPARSAETPEGTAKPKAGSVGDTGVSTGGSAGGKGGEPVAVERSATESSKKKTTSKATFRYIPSLGRVELWPIGPRQEKGRTPGTLELHTKRAVEIKDLWESRKVKNAVLAREYANRLMEGPGFAIAEDVTTAGDLQAVLDLLTTKDESASATAAKIYFEKLPRPIDALNFIAFDNAFTFEKAKNTKYRRESYKLPSGEVEGVSDAEAAFFRGLGSTNSKLATEWVKANLSEKTNKWLLEKQNEHYRSAVFQQYNTTLPDQVAENRARLAELQRADEEAFAKELTRDAVLSLDIPLHPAVSALLRNDSLQMALRALARVAPDNRVSKVASKLVRVAGDTKVKVVKNLTNEAGKPVAGIFDPQTNTISIDADAGMNPHVLLHETTHAATSATLANKSHPLTKQLTKLYEDVKDYLDTAYGAKDVDEFVSEAMSNPEFQAKLARINPKGQEINALQRFFNSVGNFLRKLVGMQTKPIGSALSEADRLIEGILAPAPKYRDAYKLAMKSTRDGVKETIKEVDATQKEVSSPPMNRKDRAEFVDGVKDLFSRLGEGTKFIVPKFLDAQSLADVASEVSDGLGKTVNKFYEAADNMRGDIAKAHEKVYDQVQIVEKWRDSKNGKEKQILLDDVIYNKDYGATIYQVDPTKPITEYQGKNRFDKSGNDLEAIWKAQRTSWNKLGPDGQRIYKTMRNMYRSQFEQLKDVVNGRIDRLLENNPEAATKLKNEILANMFRKKELDVYFPLLREGRYKISYTYKDPKTGEESYVFQMLDSKRDRDRLADELRADPNVVKDQKSGEKVKIGDGDFNTTDFSNAPSTSFVGNVIEVLNQNGRGLSDAEKEVYEDNVASIMRLFVNALPESSFAKSLQRRKNTPGYMTDSIYAMKSKGFSLASQIEKLRSTAIFQQIEADLAEVEKNPKLKPDRKGAPRSSDYLFKSIASDLKKRIRFAKYGADNKGFEQYVRFANQMTFVYTLGGNTASAAIQLAQLPMFVYPMLGADYGYQKAYDELTNASSLVLGAKMNVETIKESPGVKGKLGTAIKKLSIAHGIDSYYDVTANGDYVVKKDPRLPPERVKELERMAPLVKLMSERSHLNRSFIFDALSIQEAGSARTRGGLFQTASNILDMITGVSALMFNQSERFNRQVTAVAAYNLALDRITAENPKMPLRERQDKAAQSAVYDAQQYNGGSTLETAPSISQQGIGRVALMYKTYGLKMYTVMLMTANKLLDTYFAEKAATGSIPKATIKALKSVAFKQLLGIHGSALFFSGIHGIPIYGAIQQIADWLLPDDEDDFDTIVRNHVGEGWYKGAVNQILTELGVGADIASRVRLTGLVLQENRYNDDPSPEEFMGFYLGGPALSISKRVGRGIEDLGNGQFERGFENLMPASVANAYKGLVRYPREGGIVSRRTNMIYDDMTSGEMFAQTFGFAPSEYIRQQEETQRIKGIDKDINAQRSNLTKRLYVAARLGDWSEIATVNKEIQEFNREHPSFALSPKSIIKSLKQHMKTTETMYNGVSISPAMRRAAEDHLRGINNGFTAPVL